MARAHITATPLPRRRPAAPVDLIALAALTVAFVVWAVWTLLLPAALPAAHVNGTFGASSQADYTSDPDRRLAPQRAITRG